MHKISKSASHEKRSVALLSIMAAVFITAFKLTIGLLTRSLGILSEALHSALDLIAAIITYFSVRVSDKPPDKEHNFGHGKVENLSALFETFLLLITCVWIIYEAVSRLMTGNVHIEVNIWSYIVVISSIIIDFSRSRALSKAAKKHNSQALEADALHFSTDIWSSTVVLIGLVCANYGFHYADSIAALIVALIVIFVSIKLGKRAIDILIDKSPQDTIQKVNEVLIGMSNITNFHDIKIRTAGADIFIEMNIHVKPELTIEDAHEITHKVEEEIKNKIGRCDIHIHTEPEKN
jgi:cation diffusion facilitator family transporter